MKLDFVDRLRIIFGAFNGSSTRVLSDGKGAHRFKYSLGPNRVNRVVVKILPSSSISQKIRLNV